LEDTWPRHDSVTYASHFAEDATFIQIFGGQLDGRAAIEASHRIIIDTIYKGSYVTFAIRTIRPLGPDAAVVFNADAGPPADCVAYPAVCYLREQRLANFQRSGVDLRI